MSSHDQEDEHFGANDAVATSNGEAAREDEGTLTGCREAVEILTRNLKKGELSQHCPSSLLMFIFRQPLTISIRTASTLPC
jgi:hypothetical protein